MNFICGTYFKHQCGLQLTDYTNARDAVFVNFQNKSLDNNLVFLKEDSL